MKILSLFDGISCGQLALKRANINYDIYIASEIHEPSIQITKNKFPKTIHIGNVKNVYAKKFPIDLLIGGSPCEDLSVYKTDRQGLDGKKSSLFYEFARVLDESNPKYFLLENVASMSKENKEIISKKMGVDSIEINSSIFSAQDRKRLYWTNIPILPLPDDNELFLGDIILDSVNEKYFYDKDFELFNHPHGKVIGKIDLNGHDFLKRIYDLRQKSPTATAVCGGNQQMKIIQNGKVRKLTPIEYERLQTLPDNYTKGVSDTNRYKSVGDGWTVDVIAHIFKGINHE